jgi:hypothetical protein
MAKSGLASDLGVFTWNVSDQSGSSRVSEISYRGRRLGRVRNRMDSRCLRCRPYSTGSICPRCGERFASKWWYHNSVLLARRGAHCGLPKFAIGWHMVFWLLDNADSEVDLSVFPDINLIPDWPRIQKACCEAVRQE